MGDYNNGLLPDQCLRLDFGGEEDRSVELGDGTGYVRVSDVYDIVAGQHAIGTPQLHYLLEEYDACAGAPENTWAIQRLLQAKNDLATLRLFANELRDLLVKTYGLAEWIWGHVPVKYITIEFGKQMNEIYEAMKELGIEVRR